MKGPDGKVVWQMWRYFQERDWKLTWRSSLTWQIFVDSLLSTYARRQPDHKPRAESPAMGELADHFVDATGLVEKKIEAILCHKSQFTNVRREDGGPDKWIRDRMRTVGEKAGFEYAEGFRKLQTG